VSAGPADPQVARLVAWFEGLRPEDLLELGQYYAEEACFKDPFSDVHGLAAVQAVYAHMFEALDEPRFVVREVVQQGDHCFLTWDFLFRFKRGDRTVQTVHGASHLHFGPDGRITRHRDYWDAAEELYEKLPVIGTLMRWLKKRAAS